MQPKFVHLRFHSEYSITDGIVRLNPAIKQMKEWGVGAFGQTDLMNMFGSVRFYESCHKEGIKPILGCDLWITNEEDPAHPFRLTSTAWIMTATIRSVCCSRGPGSKTSVM